MMQWDLRRDVLLRLKTSAQETGKPVDEKTWVTVMISRIDGDKTLG